MPSPLLPTLILAGSLAAPWVLAAQTAPVPESADTTVVETLSLDEALRRASSQSEEVRLARAEVRLASAQVGSARSAALPHLTGSFTYTRTFDSPYSSGMDFELPDSLKFEPDATLPLEERVAYLEDRVPSAGLGGLSNLFGNLPFGQKNSYVAQINASQLLYSGGKVGAAMAIARSYESASRLNLLEEVAEVEYQVRTAYYRALLAVSLEESAAAALAQAEEFLGQERDRMSAGQAADLDVLRAQVSRDNLRPQLVEARNAAELALLDLKRLVDLPLDAPIRLTTPLEAPGGRAALGRLRADQLLGGRAAVLASEEQVRIRDKQVAVAKGNFLPSVSLSMAYGRQLFPTKALEFDGPWRTDWTAGISVQIPLFNGGQNISDLRAARVELDRARLQLDQLKEGVQLQYEQALAERERASQAIDARRTTVEAAQRVYDLTVLRYERGLATQLEVSQSRLELLQARTNLAQAIADFHIADAGVNRAVASVTSAAPGGAR